MSFFPPTLPKPKIEGPIQLDDGNEDSFFLYSWDNMSGPDLLSLSAFLQANKGKCLEGWTHPDENEEWTVILSDERISGVNSDTPNNTTYQVELVAFLTAGKH